jgi:hypothetical protein
MRAGANIPKHASEFVAKMIHLFLKDSPEFAEDLLVQKLVQQREFELKNNRSRFQNLEALKEWNSPVWITDILRKTRDFENPEDRK